MKLDYLIRSSSLCNFRRFDVFVKAFFASYPVASISTVPTYQIYHDHLKYWNNFQELVPERHSYVEFYNDFQHIQSANSPLQLPPVITTKDNSILNGSHRLATALKKSHPIKVLQGTLDSGQDHVSLEYLESRGFLSHYPNVVADSLILYGLSHSRKQALFVLWDSSYTETFSSILTGANLRTVAHYQTDLASADIPPIYLSHIIRIIYCDQQWLFDRDSRPLGAQHKAAQISSAYPISLFLVEPNDWSTTLEQLYDLTRLVKSQFRITTGTAHSVLHSADSFLETWSICSSLFHSTKAFSIISLATSYLPQKSLMPQTLSSFNHLPYSYWNNVVTGSAALTYYGLPLQPSDLDTLSSPLTACSYLYDHFSEKDYYPIDYYELITNPVYSFTYMGLRIIKPAILYLMKKNRGEAKDIRHLDHMSKMSLYTSHHQPKFCRVSLTNG